MNKKVKIKNIVLSGLFLALALVLPFLTGQIHGIGNMLCPMHIPVLLCGFFCGPLYGLIVGFIAPYLRFLLFGMPLLIPGAVGMSFELATYGIVAGALYRKLPKKKLYIYVSLLISMVAGRIAWGIARTVLFCLGKSEFGWKMFLTAGFVNAIPGIILQLILIPILVITLKKSEQ